MTYKKDAEGLVKLRGDFAVLQCERRYDTNLWNMYELHE